MKMSSWKVSQEKQKKGKVKQRLRQQKAKAFKRLANKLKNNNENPTPHRRGEFFYQTVLFGSKKLQCDSTLERSCRLHGKKELI